MNRKWREGGDGIINEKLILRRLTEMPDPSYPPFQLQAGGDVRSAARGDSEHFLRNVASFEAGRVSVSIRFCFEPATTGDRLQQRLSILLAGQAHHASAGPGLSLLMDRGPFHRFFRLWPVKATPAGWKRFRAACDVVRARNLLAATVPPDLNANVLPAYYTINAFEPDPDNDFLLLDSVLDRVQEPAMIEICVEPVDVQDLLAAHTRYLFLLQQVNRTWDPDDEEAMPGIPLRGRGDWSTVLKPLRQKEPLVDDILRRQRRFHETLTRPHLRFHIRVLAETAAVARLLASVVAESAFSGGSYQLLESVIGDPYLASTLQGGDRVQVTPAPVRAFRSGTRSLEIFDRLAGLSSVAPVDQLVGVFRLPVASHVSPRCIRKNTDPPHKALEEMIVLGHDEQLGEEDQGTVSRGLPRGILLGNLVKHVFITGMPGSGKTVTIFNVLCRLGALEVPLIVLEPGKSEYRRLKCLRNHADDRIRAFAQDLQVYTPGIGISPFRLNPLHHPPEISRDEHIEHLLDCFKAAMPMQGSMLGLIGEGLERVYQDHEDAGHPPRMVDLHTAVRKVLASKRYSSDVDSDFRALFDVRLGVLVRRGMGQVFQCNQNIPALDSLMTGRSILELESLPPEQACLFTLFLLTALRERIKSIPGPGRHPCLVLVLEEAHNIAGRNTDAAASEENADPRAFASEFICRMLAELRSQGVAILIADQLPSAVAPEVVKNTGSKVAFHQVNSDDRAIIGGAMLFGPIEMEEIARLRPGEAYFHTEGHFGPRRIRTPDIESELAIPSPPLREEILPLIQADAWYQEAAVHRTEVEGEQFVLELNRFDDTVRNAITRLKGMIQERVRVLETNSRKDQKSTLCRMTTKARALREQLEIALRSFQWDVYQRWNQGRPGRAYRAPSLEALHDQSVQRVETILLPTARACLDRLARLIWQCTEVTSEQQGA